MASSFEALRASSIEERARAQHFDVPGEPLFRFPNLVQQERGLLLKPPMPLGEREASVPQPSRRSVLSDVLCSAAAVGIGFAKSKRAFLTTSESRLFTDYAFSIGQWVMRLRAGPSIVISQVGGRVSVDGAVYTTPELEPIRLDVPYLVFLKSIPRTLAFQPTAAPIPVLDGRISLASLGLSQDSTGRESLQKVVAELEDLAAQCPKK